MAAASVVGLREYGRMIIPERGRLYYLYMLIGGLTCWMATKPSFIGSVAPFYMASIVVALLLLVRVRETKVTEGETIDLAPVWHRFTGLSFGYFYVVLSHSMMFWLVSRTQTHEPASILNFAWVLIAMVATWSCDTGAYFLGRKFGKTPFHPVVSPKKTMEGFGGGVLACVIGPIVTKLVLGSWASTITLWDCIAIALPAALLAPLGDLLESLLKRTYGIKDSGTLLPGHGGLLDRFDALYLVVAWTWMYVAHLR